MIAQRSRSIIAILCGLALTLSALGAIGADSAAAATGLGLERNEAVASFPAGITFRLVADAPRPITNVELLYRAAGQETLHLITPDFTSASHIDLKAELDLQTNYRPPGIDIVYHWRLTDASGAITETDPKTLLWEDDRFPWKPLRTDQVTVYAYNGDADFNQEILDSAQSTVDKLQAEFHVARSKPIRIWVYNSKDDFSDAQAPHSEPWIGGASHLGSFLILAIIPDGDRGEIGRVIPHEVSHQVLYQATWNAFNRFNGPPTWLDEGLAVSNQEEGDEEFPALVQNAANEGRLFSIKALNSAFPYDPQEATLAYAESLSVVTFIRKEYGDETLAKLFAAYRDGVSHEQAIVRTFGFSTDELDRRWKASLGYQGDRAAREHGLGFTTGRRLDRSPGGAMAPLLASGSPVMGLAAIAAVISGFLVIGRTRRLVRGRPSNTIPRLHETDGV